MITRNDDPPEDREAEYQSVLADAAHDAVMTLFEPLINSLVDMMVKRMNKMYADGYVDGAASTREGQLE